MNLSDLKRPEDYQSERTHVFPSLASFTWFKRVHRAELDAAGALVVVNRRPLINPTRCDEVVLTIGARQSAALHQPRESFGEVAP